MVDQQSSKRATASLIIIGNEILSGRTQDANLNYIAHGLAEIGVIFAEARVVLDIEEDIIKAVNELRQKYDYVFTTGGIGPTHDDITSLSISKAFGVPLIEHPEAFKNLKEFYDNKGEELNSARRKMATTPEGATLIDNSISIAPGFKMDNVYVFAGIPKIMRVMFDAVKKDLRHSIPILSRTINTNEIEGDIAADLEVIQNQYQQVEIGSYPVKEDGIFKVSVVIRGDDDELLAEVEEKVKNILKK